MAFHHGIDEGIAHQATNKANHPIGSQDPRGWEAVACDGCTFHVVNRLDQIVDAKGNGSH